MIKAILFDADGVLINAERFSRQLERDHGIAADLTLPFFSSIFQECLVGKADLKEVIAPYLLDWGFKGSVEDFLSYWFASEHKIEESVITVVRELREKGIRTYVATNNEKYRVEYMISEMGFGEIMDKIYSSASLGYKKPDREFYQSVVDDLGLKKKEVLFWDDDEKNVESAKEFGIHAQLYTSLEDFKAKLSTYL